jgi:hypothetical protein
MSTLPHDWRGARISIIVRAERTQNIEENEMRCSMLARAWPGPGRGVRTSAAALVATGILALGGCATAAPAPEAPAPTVVAPPDGAAPGPGPGSQATTPRPYAQVVRGLEADSGLFVVHRSDARLLFEIPDSLLGREMLVITRIARVPGDISGFVVAGHKVQEQVWTWERQGRRVLVRKQSHNEFAADTLPIAMSVVNNNFQPVVAAFDIQAEGPDSSVVVDVKGFYEGDTPALAALSQAQRRDFGVRRLDPTRSFIVFARSFPHNVDVRHTRSYDATSPPSGNNTGTISMELHQSMILLPAEPMRPRIADDRVGYFSVSRVNFGLPEQKAASETFIRRWRLEPSDPDAYFRGERVDPVQPIVYYVDAATPAEWRPCVRQGVVDWVPAFETAGFSNAIQVRDAPTPTEDPDFDMSDVRNNMVRWAASMVRNAMGPSVSDPRSGEIISSSIVWYHNHLRSYRNRLLIETGAANPLARSLPVDRDLLCETLRQVISHEIGHALGLPHNMIASSAYPVEKLRDPAFVDTMGIAPTIMDYARQNYIAQPGDGFEGAQFIRRIGPYDHYAINWGYRVIPGAPTPEAERPVLNRWITDRADDPVYRFLPQRAATMADPRSQTEDLGDDPVAASGYGIANLQRVAPNLVGWTTVPGEDYGELQELYGELVAQWYRYVSHVANVIGGVHVDLKTADQDGPVFHAAPRARQEAALAFLGREVFEAPTWLAPRDILDRIGASGLDAISRQQVRVLASALDARRLTRMAEIEITSPELAYPLAAYLSDLRDSVFGSLPAAAANPHRRALHRAYVEELGTLMTEEPRVVPFLGAAPSLARSDVRPLVRAQLRLIRTEAVSASRRAPDAVSRAHLEDLAERITALLDDRG